MRMKVLFIYRTWIIGLPFTPSVGPAWIRRMAIIGLLISFPGLLRTEEMQTYPSWLEPYAIRSESADATDSRFTAWLDTRAGFRAMTMPFKWDETPLTVELWMATRMVHGYQMLVGAHPRGSAKHWELYVEPDGSTVGAFLPGRNPDRVRAAGVIVDRRWHHLALVLTANETAIHVDGVQVAQVHTTVDSPSSSSSGAQGRLSLGFVSHGTDDLAVPSDCRIAELRISNTARMFHGVVPMPGRPIDNDTMALWILDGNDRDLVGDVALTRVARPAGLPSGKQIGVPLDAIGLAEYAPGSAPMDAPATTIALDRAPSLPASGNRFTSLDGTWELAENGSDSARLGDAIWSDALPAVIPGSIHAALERSGRIPDPKFGFYDAIARKQSDKTWWLRRSFKRPDTPAVGVLNFEGVAISCTVWLNGQRLGEHNGMFGGPRFAIPALADQNTLVVRLDPAPSAPPFFSDDNNGWRQTVVFNCVWGWHYSNIPALGIWRSVWLEHALPITFSEKPFITTRDAALGTMDLQVRLHGPAGGWQGRLIAEIVQPDGAGSPLGFTWPVVASDSDATMRLSFTIPTPRLWWPNGYGDQPMYHLRLAIEREGGGDSDRCETSFGIRNLRMAPSPSGPRPDSYNWTFVINGRPLFMKGAGWCTMDSSMDFRPERYARFLRAACQANCTILRAWGGGMPETDAFYDLCDRLGILVIQEWPTAWNSHYRQPYDALEETVRLNTIRIRNHPSLAMMGGGNESNHPFGRVIDMMGRLAQELDGTRPFHRSSPFGGSIHNYGCWWEKKPLDHNLGLRGQFIGEFGIASVPITESVRRYLPEDEIGQWPPAANGAFVHHTPVFNTKEDLSRLRLYADVFSAGKDMADFIRASQTAQAVALRHTLERARTDWPASSGAIFYKLNDNYPAASWSTIDWYGAAKLSHWFVRSAFASLHTAVLLPSFDLRQDVRLPVVLLDDTGATAGKRWVVKVRAVGPDLKALCQQEWSGTQVAPETVRKLGDLSLTCAMLESTSPLLLVAEVWVDDVMRDRSWSFANFASRQGCLYALPRTTLQMAVCNGVATVTNTGKLPAIGVEVVRPGHAHDFTAGDGMLWLEPGEKRIVSVSAEDGLLATAWNLQGEQP